MIDCGFGRSSDLFLTTFRLPMAPAGATVASLEKLCNCLELTAAGHSVFESLTVGL